MFSTLKKQIKKKIFTSQVPIMGIIIMVKNNINMLITGTRLLVMHASTYLIPSFFVLKLSL